MLYQPLNPVEAITELTFILLRRAHDLYYDALTWNRDAKAVQHPIDVTMSANMLDTLHYEVRQAELHYAELGHYCEHHYAQNAQGDYVCTRCLKYSLLHKVIDRLGKELPSG